jgi:CubicO group peptidase (beta-lactamase class C family)
MAKKPFTEFKYNSGCPMIIAGIIEKTTRMSLEDFAKKYLFEPLGITEYRWLKNSKGFCHAGGGSFLKPIDMFKIGELVLNIGKWKNIQIVSENWIERTTQPYFPTTVNNNGYGYFWWIKEIKINESKTIKVISAQGAGGQHTYIFPDYDLVVSFTERNYNTPLVGQFIIEDLILKLTK